MSVKIKINEDDYILYEILCDYCDEEYTIKYITSHFSYVVRESFRPPSTPYRSNLVSSRAKACAQTAQNVANNS